MARLGAPVSRNLLRRATARLVVIALLLLIFTADRLHNHPGTGDFPGGVTPGESGARLSTAPGHAVPGRAFPCPACLHHRTFSVDPLEKAPEGRLVAVSRERQPLPDSPPPADPVPTPPGPRAPPRSS